MELTTTTTIATITRDVAAENPQAFDAHCKEVVDRVTPKWDGLDLRVLLDHIHTTATEVMAELLWVPEEPGYDLFHSDLVEEAYHRIHHHYGS